MRKSLLRRTALSSVAIAALMLSSAPPALAEPVDASTSGATGTISGRLTTSTGSAVAEAKVYVYDKATYDIAGSAVTDAHGNYTIADVDPGTYLVEFSPSSGPTQYYRQQTRFGYANPVTVTSGATTIVDDQLLPTGVITGHLRTATGEPLRDVHIRAWDEETYAEASGRTDENGRYRLDARPGRYLVAFQPLGDFQQEQFVPGKLDKVGADLIEVRVGEEVVVDDVALPVGSLSGKFTDQAGQPMAGIEVSVATVNSYYAANGGLTNANGVFRVPALLAGTYHVTFSDGDWLQYFRGKLSAEDATPVVITGGAATRANDKLLGTGSVRVTAVDAVTGAPVANFCVESQCSSGSGAVTIGDLHKGQHDLHIYTEDGSYHDKELSGVRVRVGQVTEKTVKLRPAAVITTTVVDRVTGNPVPGVCLAAFLPKQAALLDGYGNCSDANGRVSVGWLKSGSYRLFAVPRGSTYGRQWVGPDGGTGDERQAAVVTAEVGQVVTAPQIKLDRAGTVTGRVTDAGTGAPIESAFVSVLTGHPGAGVSDARTDADGRYTLRRLGPYEWPIVVQSFGYASQWSGSAPSRYTATPVTVSAGAGTTNDVALAAGTEVTGTFTNTDGVPFEDGWVIARNAQSGDIAGQAWLSEGRFTMRVTGRQRVYFTYHVFQDGEYYEGRYTVTNPDGTKSVPRFTVPASGALTVNLVVPTN